MANDPSNKVSEQTEPDSQQQEAAGDAVAPKPGFAYPPPEQGGPEPVTRIPAPEANK